jgi:hypothetical protein
MTEEQFLDKYKKIRIWNHNAIAETAKIWWRYAYYHGCVPY